MAFDNVNATIDRIIRENYEEPMFKDEERIFIGGEDALQVLLGRAQEIEFEALLRAAWEHEKELSGEQIPY